MSVRLTFGRLIAYSTNQLPLNMAALPVVLNVSHFYGEVLKVPLGIMGLIFIAARVIDAIQDPVIGLISDKFTHRGPRGRLTFVALMLPPHPTTKRSTASLWRNARMKRVQAPSTVSSFRLQAPRTIGATALTMA